MSTCIFVDGFLQYFSCFR